MLRNGQRSEGMGHLHLQEQNCPFHVDSLISDEGTIIHQNLRNLSPKDTVLHFRRQDPHKIKKNGIYSLLGCNECSLQDRYQCCTETPGLYVAAIH